MKVKEVYRKENFSIVYVPEHYENKALLFGNEKMKHYPDEYQILQDGNVLTSVPTEKIAIDYLSGLVSFDYKE